MDLTLTLTKDEIEGILKVLGSLPTSSNAWPLAMKVSKQLEDQTAPKEEPKDEAA